MECFALMLFDLSVCITGRPNNTQSTKHYHRGGVSVYGGLISAVGFTSVNKSKITKVQNTIREPMGVMVISFPVSLQGKAVNVFKHGHI